MIEFIQKARLRPNERNQLKICRCVFGNMADATSVSGDDDADYSARVVQKKPQGRQIRGRRDARPGPQQPSKDSRNGPADPEGKPASGQRSRVRNVQQERQQKQVAAV